MESARTRPPRQWWLTTKAIQAVPWCRDRPAGLNTQRRTALLSRFQASASWSTAAASVALDGAYRQPSSRRSTRPDRRSESSCSSVHERGLPSVAQSSATWCGRSSVFRSRRSNSIDPTESTAPSSRPFKLRGGHVIVDRTYSPAEQRSRGDPGIRSWPYRARRPPGGDRGKPRRRPRERGRDTHRRAVGPWEGAPPRTRARGGSVMPARPPNIPDPGSRLTGSSGSLGSKGSVSSASEASWTAQRLERCSWCSSACSAVGARCAPARVHRLDLIGRDAQGEEQRVAGDDQLPRRRTPRPRGRRDGEDRNLRWLTTPSRAF